MSDRWLYTPEICDGDLCIADCDKCPKADVIFEIEEMEK